MKRIFPLLLLLGSLQILVSCSSAPVAIRLNPEGSQAFGPFPYGKQFVADTGIRSYLCWLGVKDRDVDVLVTEIDFSEAIVIGNSVLPGRVGTRLAPGIYWDEPENELILYWLERKGQGRTANYSVGVANAPFEELSSADIRLFDYGRSYQPPKLCKTAAGLFIAGVSRVIDGSGKRILMLKKQGRSWKAVELPDNGAADGYPPEVVDAGGQQLLIWIRDGELKVSESRDGGPFGEPVTVSKGRVDAFHFIPGDREQPRLVWTEEGLKQCRLWTAVADPEGSWGEPSEAGVLEGNAVRFLGGSEDWILTYYLDRKTSCGAISSTNFAGREVVRVDRVEDSCTRPLSPFLFTEGNGYSSVWLSSVEEGQAIFLSSASRGTKTWGQAERVELAQPGRGFSSPRVFAGGGTHWLLYFEYRITPGPVKKHAPRGDIILERLEALDPWYRVFW